MVHHFQWTYGPDALRLDRRLRRGVRGRAERRAAALAPRGRAEPRARARVRAERREQGGAAGAVQSVTAPCDDVHPY